MALVREENEIRPLPYRPGFSAASGSAVENGWSSDALAFDKTRIYRPKWSLAAVFIAVVFDESRMAYFWSSVVIGMVIVSGLVQPFLRESNNLPEEIIRLFFVLNILGPSLVAAVVINFIVDLLYGVLDPRIRVEGAHG